MIVWIIMWRYYDGSDCGVIDRAFKYEEEARWLAQTLTKDGDTSRIYSLISVEVKS